MQMQCNNSAVWHGRGKCCGVRYCKGWARQGHFAIEQCRDTVGLGTAGILCCWALCGCCWALQDTLQLRAAGILCGWALQGYSTVGHTRGILCVWALQGYVAIEHSSQPPRRGRGQHRLLKSNNPTPRMGNKKNGFSVEYYRGY